MFCAGDIYSLGHLIIPDRPHVLRFDVKKERCKFVPLPHDDYTGIGTSRANFLFSGFSDCLGVCEWRLCFAKHDSARQSLLVWVLDDCEFGKWVLKHVLKEGPEGSRAITAFHPSLAAVLVRRSGDFYWHDLRSEKFEKIAYFSLPIDDTRAVVLGLPILGMLWL